MPSELLKLLKCTIGAVLDTDDIAIPARFVDIGVDNAPAPSEKVFHKEVANDLFHNEWDKSGICDRSQLNGSKAEHSIFSSFPIHLKSTAFQLFDLISPSELCND